VCFSVFINRSMFVKHHHVSLKDATSSTDESVFHPLPALFRLLGLSPFKKVIVGSHLYLWYIQSMLFGFLAACGKCDLLVSHVSCTRILTCIIACFLGRVNSW
jgi:hypothetical protein